MNAIARVTMDRESVELLSASARDTAATLRTLLGCIAYWCETSDPVRPETADELAAQIQRIVIVATQVSRSLDGIARDLDEAVCWSNEERGGAH